MDRPKHRWFIVLAVLLAGVLLLSGRQWVSITPDRVSTSADVPAPRAVQPQSAGTAAPATSESVEDHSTLPAAVATGGTVRGRIVDAVTRQPIREFQVRLVLAPSDGIIRPEDSITRQFQSQTGRFAWSNVAPGTWRALVTTRGYQLFNAGSYEVVAGKPTRETVMPLLRGHAVRGRVFELSTGAGIAGASISFREASSREFLRERAGAKSNDDGSFVLDGVAGGEVILVATAEQHARREVEIVVDEQTPPQEIALSAGGTIGGMVTTVAGVPIDGEVWLSGSALGPGVPSQDASPFSFDHLPAATYSIKAQTSAGSAEQQIVLGPDERRNDIVLVVGGGHSVRGTLRGLRPELLKRVFIGLHMDAASFSSQVDEQGAYVMHGVPAGQAQLRMSGASRQLFKIVTVPADRDLVVDFTFPPGARLSGRVTQGGKPVTVSVWVTSVEPGHDLWYRAWTDEDGRYEIEALPPGEYRVQADRDVSRPLAIAGDAVLDIDIPLVQLAGRVTQSGSSAPVVRASVFVRSNDAATAGMHADAQTDDFGQFSVTGIEPGEILLTVYKPGYELYREKLSYSTPVTDKTIALRTDRGVEVRVHRTSSSDDPVRELIVVEDLGNLATAVFLRVPVDRQSIGFLPSGLSGSQLQILLPGSGPRMIPQWDGLPLDLTY